MILAAAERVFVDQGYGASTMEEIARAAEMSKKTLYQYFTDKESLFAALLQSDVMPDFPEVPADGPASPELLRETFSTIARAILAPRHIALTRLVISEAPKTPELAASFYYNYIERFRRTVFDRLLELENAGMVEATRALAMIEPIMGIILGPVHIKTLLCCEMACNEALEERVDFVMKLIGLECPDRALRDTAERRAKIASV
ncbi:TetR/AcrR family transcriptional regulator [Rhizobium sp. CG5]|uniref:TetR/AcrR family transcriptional regulator n=1 Tax=Rhizobium sp. CG5 TaxID=2726076 RepID=UPI00203429B8|nr:TetR/AcrR family transcriptional regulator [Rhizobium sp. CG5]MCM2475848.1 TetR/AcrR family transcriptional regulator [Rhizobium sp. CG5]